MRKIFLFIFLLSIPLVYGVSTTMLPDYQPSETMIIEIQGNILSPIDRSDVVFKRAHVAIAVDYDVKRIGNRYYLYAQMPINPNNYTLFIDDIATTVNGAVTTVDYNQTFSVSGNRTDYSVSPAIAVVNRDFQITVTSYRDDAFFLNLSHPERSVTIGPGSNVIPISIESLSAGTYFVTAGKYSLPIQVISNSQTTASQSASIIASPALIRRAALANQSSSYNFTLRNVGNSSADSLYFSFDQTLFDISPSLIGSLPSNGSKDFVVSLRSTSGPDVLGGILVLNGDDTVANVTLDIAFTSNQSQVSANSNNNYYCSELGGKFCAANEVCSITAVQSLDGSCCTALCEPVESGGSSEWITYGLALAVLVIAIVVYMRYKKTRLPKPKALAIESLLKK